MRTNGSVYAENLAVTVATSSDVVAANAIDSPAWTTADDCVSVRICGPDADGATSGETSGETLAMADGSPVARVFRR